jgi:hypothetical protein
MHSNIIVVKTFNVDMVEVTINKLALPAVEKDVATPSSAAVASTVTDDRMISLNFTTFCRQGEYGNYSFTCPDSGHELVNTCQGNASIIVAYCPKKTIGCSVLSMEDQTVASG